VQAIAFTPDGSSVELVVAVDGGQRDLTLELGGSAVKPRASEPLRPGFEVKRRGAATNTLELRRPGQGRELALAVAPDLDGWAAVVPDGQVTAGQRL
jgi:hypothetical protein